MIFIEYCKQLQKKKKTIPGHKCYVHENITHTILYYYNNIFLRYLERFLENVAFFVIFLKHIHFHINMMS